MHFYFEYEIYERPEFHLVRINRRSGMDEDNIFHDNITQIFQFKKNAVIDFFNVEDIDGEIIDVIYLLKQQVKNSNRTFRFINYNKKIQEKIKFNILVENNYFGKGLFNSLKELSLTPLNIYYKSYINRFKLIIIKKYFKFFKKALRRNKSYFKNELKSELIGDFSIFFKIHLSDNEFYYLVLSCDLSKNEEDKESLITFLKDVFNQAQKEIFNSINNMNVEDPIELNGKRMPSLEFLEQTVLVLPFKSSVHEIFMELIFSDDNTFQDISNLLSI